MPELKKVTIKKISRTERVSKKTNKPFTSVGLLVDGKDGEIWINGFGNRANQDWQDGDEVEIIIKKNGEYWNFETPTAESKLGGLEARVKALEEWKAGFDKKTPLEEADLETERIDISDLPFN